MSAPTACSLCGFERTILGNLQLHVCARADAAGSAASRRVTNVGASAEGEPASAASLRQGALEVGDDKSSSGPVSRNQRDTFVKTRSPMSKNTESREIHEHPAASVAMVSSNAPPSVSIPMKNVVVSAPDALTHPAQTRGTQYAEIPPISPEKAELHAADLVEPPLNTATGECQDTARSRGQEHTSGGSDPHQSADASVNSTFQGKNLLAKNGTEKDAQMHHQEEQAPVGEDSAVPSMSPSLCLPAPIQRLKSTSLSASGEDQALAGPDPFERTICGHDTENSADAEDLTKNTDNHVNDINRNALSSRLFRSKDDIGTFRLGGGALASNKLSSNLSIAKQEILGNHVVPEKRGNCREPSVRLGDDKRRSVRNRVPGSISSLTGVDTRSVTSTELLCQGQKKQGSNEETALSGSSLAVLDKKRAPAHEAHEDTPVSANEIIPMDVSVDSSANTAMKGNGTLELLPAAKLSVSGRYATTLGSAVPPKASCEAASGKPENTVSIVTPIERPRRNGSRGAAIVPEITGKVNMAIKSGPPKRMSRRKIIQKKVEPNGPGKAENLMSSLGSDSKRENAGLLGPNGGLGNEGMMSVRAPTAFDEVRYELRPSVGAPVLERPALRSSGHVTVVQLAKFIRGQLGARESTDVIISCAGEEISDTMTLNLLVGEVWPKEDGHLILDYRFEAGNGVL